MSVPEDLVFRFPGNSRKNFYSLADLHGGHASFACSTSFEIIVLKFHSRESTRSLDDLENEAFNWKKIYGVNAHVRKINGENVIVMPHVHMCSESDWDKEATLQSALKVVIISLQAS